MMELLKQDGWNNKSVRLSHYRTHAGQEVDIILEAGTRVVGVEVKAASNLTADHYKGLRHLRDELGDTLHRGIVLYTGQQTVAVDERIWAVPVSGLWEANSVPAEPLALLVAPHWRD